MKKIALLTISSLFITSAFAYEINFSKSFSKELMPNILSTNLSIRIDAGNEKKISNRLEVFNKRIKQNKVLDKKLGSYSIRPKYSYVANKPRKISSYIGELKYQIESTNDKEINRFITSLNSLKKSKDTSIIVSGLSWKVKDDTHDIAIDDLRLEAIHWIEKYVSSLSKDLGKKCKVKNINISSSNQVRPYYASRSLKAMSSDSIPVTQANNQKISIKPNYKVECK